MKIILLKKIKNLGQAGEVKEVLDGYARNFLIPRGLADITTKHGLRVMEAREKKQVRLKTTAKKEKAETAKKIDGRTFTIQKKADGKGTLYAKLDAKALAEELAKIGCRIEAKEIKLEKPIKNTGEHKVEAALAGETAWIKVMVEGE